MNEALRKTLKQLRLSGLLESLEVRLQEAAGHGLSHGEFLELILQDELAVRGDRQLERRFKAAQFRELKSLEDFDWSFNPSIPRKQIYDLASCRFLREGRDVLWLGPPGVGKSFLVQAIGYQAIKAGYTVLYRSIFDLVRDFLHDEVLGQEDKMLTQVPQARAVDHRRHGDEAVAQAFRRVPVRDRDAAVRDAVDDDDLEPSPGGLGKAAGRRAQRHGDPGPVPAPRGAGADDGPELPAATSFGSGSRSRSRIQNQPMRPPARRGSGRVQNQPMRPPARRGSGRVQNQPMRPPARRGSGRVQNQPMRPPARKCQRTRKHESAKGVMLYQTRLRG